MILPPAPILKIKNNISNNIIIPQEYFLSYLDYIKVIFLQFKKEYILTNEIKFNGQNIKYLIRGEILNNLLEKELRNNLLYYFIAKNLSKKLKCEIFTYIFENHPWEKINIFYIVKYLYYRKIGAIVDKKLDTF